MLKPIPWHEVERLMEQCVRGSGYLPTTQEQRLLERAMRSDPRRYRATNKRIKGEAEAEIAGDRS